MTRSRKSETNYSKSNYVNSDELIRDRITSILRVREKLLNVVFYLMLEKAIDVARSHKLAQAQVNLRQHKYCT